MRKKMLAGASVLCVAFCYVAWAHEPADDEPGEQDAPVQKTAQEPQQDLPKQRRVIRTPPKRHATEAEDLASEQAIHAQSAALFAEYNNKNARAFGDLFVPKAEYELDSGEVIVGREAIQDYFAQSFEQNSDLKVHLNENTIRLVSLHMAIEEGNYSITGKPEEGESVVPYVQIWTAVEGKWYLACVRELLPKEAPQPVSAHEHLQDLAWLLGDWVDESNESIVKTSCRWSEDGNFLLQDFTVQEVGAELMTGTQRIGWDPSTHELRAWLFDSRGGHGQSVWNWDGKRWVVRAEEVRYDGENTSSLNFLTPLGPDSFRWEASHRMTGDNALPDMSVLVVRQAPAPEVPPASDKKD